MHTADKPLRDAERDALPSPRHVPRALRPNGSAVERVAVAVDGAMGAAIERARLR